MRHAFGVMGWAVGAALLAGCTTSIQGCPVKYCEETAVLEVPAGAARSLVVDARAGSIDAGPGADATKVVVHALKRAPSKEDLLRIKVRAVSDDGHVRVGYEVDGDDAGISVSFTVAAPATIPATPGTGIPNSASARPDARMPDAPTPPRPGPPRPWPLPAAAPRPSPAAGAALSGAVGVPSPAAAAVPLARPVPLAAPVDRPADVPLSVPAASSVGAAAPRPVPSPRPPPAAGPLSRPDCVSYMRIMPLWLYATDPRYPGDQPSMNACV